MIKKVLVLTLLATLIICDDSLISQAIQKFVNKIPEMKNRMSQQLSQTKSEVVNKIVGRGFTSFKQSGTISHLQGVSDSMLDQYINYLAGQIQLPNGYLADFKESLSQILWMDKNTWNVYDVVFSRTTGGQCKYICVMSKHDESTSTTEWLVADIQATFTLAPDVYVISQSKSSFGGMFGSSKQTIKYVPHSITQDQLDVIFSFFQIVAFERFAELYNISGGKLQLPLNQAAGGFMGAVSSGISMYKDITSAFKTTKSETLKQVINGKGFDYFKQQAQVQKIVGLREDRYTVFVDHTVQRIKVPAANQKDLQYVLEDMEFMDENTWVMNNIMFSIDQGGSTKFTSVIGQHDYNNQKYNMLLCDVNVSFKLAPDLMVITKAASYAGGIYENTKDVYKKVPRSLTEDDMKAVFNFFFVLAFKTFADAVGIKLDFPAMPQ